MKKVLFFVATLFISVNMTAQVGVGTTTPAGALDVNSTTNGFIPPRVALTATNVAAPVVNPQGGALVAGTIVWNTATAGSMPNNVAPGLYYWDGTRWVSFAGSPGGLDWSIIGNGGIDGGTVTTGGANFLGTYDNTNIDIRTNGQHRARVSNLGEFFIGAYNTVLPGDLMNGVANAAFPWAVNGYTNFDGAGTYGMVQSGSTNFAGVQGEYYGSGAQGPGVRGITNTTGTGTNYTGTTTSAVNGQLGNNSQYSFGVFGQTTSNTQRRVGGVLGVFNNSGAWGSLGYRPSTGSTTYGVFANNTDGTFGNGAGRMNTSNYEIKNRIGIGIISSFFGGFVKGKEYGLIIKGDRFASYADGVVISNKSLAIVDKGANGNKIATYAATSTTSDITSKGIGQLVNGNSTITFDKSYSELISSKNPIIVTVTPMGETKGVYVVNVNETGFSIKENGNGNSNVKFYWTVISERKNANDALVPNEVLKSDFNENIDKVMHDENNPQDAEKGMWWNGSTLEFGKNVPAEKSEGQNKVEATKRPTKKTDQ